MFSTLDKEFIITKYRKTRAYRAHFHKEWYFRISAVISTGARKNGENEGVRNGGKMIEIRLMTTVFYNVQPHTHSGE